MTEHFIFAQHLIKSKIHLKLSQLFFGDLLILAKLLVLRLVDEDDPVSLQERLRQQTLREGRKSGLDHRQVDAVDGDVVARRALAGRLSSAVDGDGARDVADRNIVAVFLNLHFLFRGDLKNICNLFQSLDKFSWGSKAKWAKTQRQGPCVNKKAAVCTNPSPEKSGAALLTFDI